MNQDPITVERPARARRVRRFLLLLGCAALGGCNLLQNEFLTLDRVPPGLQGAAAPAPSAVGARP